MAVGFEVIELLWRRYFNYKKLDYFGDWDYFRSCQKYILIKIYSDSKYFKVKRNVSM